jgi:membrane-bound lytic murein transglycosylase F
VDALATRNVFVDCDIAFAVGPKREQAWAVAPARRALRDDLDRFFVAARKDGMLARLAERYFEAAGEVARNDSAIFQERMQTVLPRYRGWFEDAQAATGIEWRLIAAVAYQESQWDPSATSETGVRGFMQITEETASYLRIADRLDPHASTIGASRYLAELKAKLPARIAEPDRTWLALAAFNIGAGHLEDARVLAQRQKGNPDLWADVRKALPLLALPEHYELAKNGYARGGMPVVFVDRVRAYYDILLRQAPASSPPSPGAFLVASIP